VVQQIIHQYNSSNKSETPHFGKPIFLFDEIFFKLMKQTKRAMAIFTHFKKSSKKTRAGISAMTFSQPP